MKMLLLLLLCLLPAGGMAVTEDVVEEAPQIEVSIDEESDVLFGAWEEALSDIRFAARTALADWMGCPAAMELEDIRVSNSPMDGDSDNDRIAVGFRYERDDGVGMRAIATFERGTGALMECTDVVYQGGEATEGKKMQEDELLNRARKRLSQQFGEEALMLVSAGSINDMRFVSTFSVPYGAQYKVCLDSVSGDVISVTMTNPKEK